MRRECEIEKSKFEIRTRTGKDRGAFTDRKCGALVATVSLLRTSKRRWLSGRGGIFLLTLAMMVASSLLCCPAQGRSQNLDKTVMNVDEEVTAFGYAPDGRIVFSVRKMFKAKKYDLQRDDIWLLETNGKRKRLLEGQKFTRGDKPFTYQVESFTWSPNGHIVAIQLYTSTVDPEDDSREDARALLLLDDSGRELHPAGQDPLVMNAESPMWLRDNGTLVYLVEEIAPRQLFSMRYLYMSSGPQTKVFEGRTFIDAARIPGSNSAIAIERDRAMDGPARMQKLELLAQDDKELATLDSFVGAGGLSISPTGRLAAYFVDNEVLEIRSLEELTKVARMRVGLGVLQWSADETTIYLKRTVEKKSADLVSFEVPGLVARPRGAAPLVLEPEPRQLLHGLTVREYGLSPDGRFLAVVLPGKRNLQVFGF
jgi:dipeptidyl aminopeptidase/acylaminoacyl peptidase